MSKMNNAQYIAKIKAALAPLLLQCCPSNFVTAAQWEEVMRVSSSQRLTTVELGECKTFNAGSFVAQCASVLHKHDLGLTHLVVTPTGTLKLSARPEGRWTAPKRKADAHNEDDDEKRKQRVLPIAMINMADQDAPLYEVHRGLQIALSGLRNGDRPETARLSATPAGAVLFGMGELRLEDLTFIRLQCQTLLTHLAQQRLNWLPEPAIEVAFASGGSDDVYSPAAVRMALVRADG